MGTEVLSALARNRKEFFDLVESAEQQFNCAIDEMALEAEIDGSYDGRDSLTDAEAQDLLMKVSRPRKQPAAASGG